MELRINDYVRTKYGIAKIIDISCGEDLWFDNDNIFDEDEKEIFRYDKPSMYSNWAKNNIIKSSPNIIDLIKYGDIVKYKIDDEEFLSEIWGEKNDYFVQNFDVPIDLKDLNIISIVTKEQFESIQYKVSD